MEENKGKDYGISLLVIVGLIWGFSSLPSKKESSNPLNIPSSFSEASANRFSEDSYVREDDPYTERSYEETGDMDCSDFSSQEEAQEFFEEEGGPDEDYHNLDRDGDGFVCESL